MIQLPFFRQPVSSWLTVRALRETSNSHHGNNTGLSDISQWIIASLADYAFHFRQPALILPVLHLRKGILAIPACEFKHASGGTFVEAKHI